MSDRSKRDQGELSRRTEPLAGSAGWTDACWDDMRKRAAAGEPFAAEQYLSQVPAPTLEQKIDLIYGAYLVRSDSDAPIDAEAFFGRYPECLAALRRQLQLDEAMGQLDGPAGDSPSAGALPLPLQPAVDASSTACDGKALPPRIGRYHIVARLAGGAQATVYRGYDPQLKRDILIKLGQGTERDACQWHSHAEAVIAAQLDHPHLALTLDAGVHQGRPYVVSRFIEGKTFGQWVRSDKPCEHEVAAVIAIAARALAEAHRAGILHLDIKPDNIVIDRQQQPHVIDFGLALLQNLHHPCSDAEGVIRGTLLYMSPEQARGDSQALCNATDVFGLAATMLLGLVGQPPYDPAVTASIEAIGEGRWRRELLNTVPLSHRMKAILIRALAANPAERFHSMEQFADRLEQLTSERSPRGHRKRLLQTSLALIVGLGAVAGPWDRWLHQVPSLQEPTLRVLVTGEQGDLVPLAQRGPLQTGDTIRITGQLRHSAVAVLFAIGPRSDVKILQKFAASRSPRTFSLPENHANAIPLTGETGTEIIGLAHGKDTEEIERALRTFASSRPGKPLPTTTSITSGTPTQLASHLVAHLPNLDSSLTLAHQQLAGRSRDLGEEVIMNPGDSLASIIRSLAAHLPQGASELEVVIFPHLPRGATASNASRPAD